MGSYTGYLRDDNTIFSNTNCFPIVTTATGSNPTVLTLPANQYPTKIVITGGYVERVMSVNAPDTIVLCNNNRSIWYGALVEYWLICQADGGTLLDATGGGGKTWEIFDGIGLAGSALYLGCTNTADQTRHTGLWTVTITTATVPAHPKVTKGTIMYKSQMDVLRTYKSNSPTQVTLNDKIYNSQGVTYAPTSGLHNAVTASWYNNA